MLRKDIIEGREYAVVRHARQNASLSNYSKYDVTRMSVVKVHDKEPHQASEGYFGEKNRIVEYKPLARWDDDKKAWKPLMASTPNYYCATRRVIAPWDEYVEALEKSAARAADWQRERDVRAAALRFDAKTLRERQEKLGLPEHFKLSVDDHRGSATLRFTGSIHDVSALLDRLERSVDVTADEAEVIAAEGEIPESFAVKVEAMRDA